MDTLKQRVGNIHSLAGLNKKDPQLCYDIKKATSFLPEKARLIQRIWHINNDIYSIPLCRICDKPVNWNSSAVKDDVTGKYTSPNKYSNYCSYKCNMVDEDNKNHILSKRKQRFEEKYGTDNPMKVQQFRDKQQTSVALKDQQQVLATRKQTNQQRYGVDNTMFDPQIRSKHREIMVSKRKTSKPTLTDQILYHGYVIERKTAFEIAHQYQISRQTVDRMLKRLNLKLFNRGGISLESINTLNNKALLEDMHYTQQMSQTQIAAILKVHQTTLSKKFIDHGIETQYFFTSNQQKQVTQFINECGVQTITNVRNIIPPKELDIFIPSHNLAIEYCGLYWHSDKHDRITNNYHYDKWKSCNDKGIRLLTIFEDEWLEKQDIVKQKIINCLKMDTTKSVFARKCQIVIPEHIQYVTLYNENHIQGNGPGSITYGLQYDNQLVAAMTFIDKHNGTYILNRYATSVKVAGGFSKLLKHFQKRHNWKQIVSFADLRWSDGKLYETNGFVLDKILPPDYYWVVDNQRQHKFNWRHNNRLKHLPAYDPNLSESVNMANHGYHKIYNCGLQRWIITR